MTPHESPPERVRLVESSGEDDDVDPRYVERLARAGAFFWLDLDQVPKARVREFADALALSEESDEYLADQEQRSNFAESHEGVRWTFFGVRDASRLTQVRAVYTASFLVTVHDDPCPALARARHRYERLQVSDRNDGSLVLFMVLDALASSFELPLAALDARLDELEAAVLGGEPLPDYLSRVIELRRLLAPILRALGPYRRDLVGLLVDVERLPGMQAGTQPYLDAHRNHVNSLFEAASDCRAKTRDALQSYSTATSDRQNEVMSWLTIVAVIFLPLSFVTGYFGMNLPFITDLRGDALFWWIGVALPLLLTLTTVYLLRLLLRRKGIRLLPLPRRDGRRHEGTVATTEG